MRRAALRQTFRLLRLATPGEQVRAMLVGGVIRGRKWGSHAPTFGWHKARDRGNEPDARDRPNRSCIKSRSSLRFIEDLAALLNFSNSVFRECLAESYAAISGFHTNTESPALHLALLVHRTNGFCKRGIPEATGLEQ